MIYFISNTQSIISNFKSATIEDVVEYCKDMYPEAKIYKSHELSLLPVEIRLPL